MGKKKIAERIEATAQEHISTMWLNSDAMFYGNHQFHEYVQNQKEDVNAAQSEAAQSRSQTAAMHATLESVLEKQNEQDKQQKEVKKILDNLHEQVNKNERDLAQTMQKVENLSEFRDAIRARIFQTFIRDADRGNPRHSVIQAGNSKAHDGSLLDDAEYTLSTTYGEVPGIFRELYGIEAEDAKDFKEFSKCLEIRCWTVRRNLTEGLPPDAVNAYEDIVKSADNLITLVKKGGKDLQRIRSIQLAMEQSEKVIAQAISAASSSEQS